MEELSKLRRITADPTEQLLLEQEAMTASLEKFLQENGTAEVEPDREMENRKGGHRHRPDRRKAEPEEVVRPDGEEKGEKSTPHGGKNPHKKEKKPEKETFKAKLPTEEGKPNRTARRNAGKTMIEKALPQDKPATLPENAEKKNQNSRWHRRPHHNRPKKPKGPENSGEC